MIGLTHTGRMGENEGSKRSMKMHSEPKRKGDSSR